MKCHVEASSLWALRVTSQACRLSRRHRSHRMMRMQATNAFCLSPRLALASWARPTLQLLIGASRCPSLKIFDFYSKFSHPQLGLRYHKACRLASFLAYLDQLLCHMLLLLIRTVCTIPSRTGAHRCTPARHLDNQNSFLSCQKAAPLNGPLETLYSSSLSLTRWSAR